MFYFPKKSGEKSGKKERRLEARIQAVDTFVLETYFVTEVF